MRANASAVEKNRQSVCSSKLLEGKNLLIKDRGSATEVGKKQHKKNVEEYDIIEIQGKHGLIKLHVPKREPTQDEIEKLHRSFAEIAIDISKNVKKKAAEKR
ncbi:hypothetical protein [Siminovitchia fordii]|uniref:Uncharacterized protein n=1 Tax=Siminovitchia fordii TaxID=254759 RepID=A0ABQ4JZC2_9BACI|nr:hypothetical protein [Siminovitchia fordii]GIN18892.1 hypothetical protein J1TS3_00260 [Siminovitchia fordii]